MWGNEKAKPLINNDLIDIVMTPINWRSMS